MPTSGTKHTTKELINNNPNLHSIIYELKAQNEKLKTQNEKLDARIASNEILDKYAKKKGFITNNKNYNPLSDKPLSGGRKSRKSKKGGRKSRKNRK
jgi:regulator of replication initiation timing